MSREESSQFPIAQSMCGSLVDAESLHTSVRPSVWTDVPQSHHIFGLESGGEAQET